MRILLSLAITALATATSAEPLVVSSTTIDLGGDAVSVDLIATNAERVPHRIDVALTIEATLEAPNGEHRLVRLERVTGEPETVTLPPSGFARLRYRFPLPAGIEPGLLALTLPGAQAVALTYPGRQTRLAEAAPAQMTPVPASPPLTAPSRPSAEECGRSGFLANLSSYEPIYAVYGPGTNTDARIQISLKYQLFGTPGERGSWLNGITFAYTQQMFWDLGRNSSPFHDVNYMPELYYALPKLASVGGWALGGRFGVRHQSNGRSGAASRSINTIYVESEADTTIAGLDVAVGPRAWVYVGSRSGNPDIAHYRGNAGLFARIGTPDGLQLDATGRLNPNSGKGAAEALVSYPLTRLFASGPKLYLFGQGFVGYGEDLLDYDRRQTRLRVGIGITR